MRFIGSKRLLLNNIDEAIIYNIEDHQKLESFCDIFSGTAYVANYFKKKYRIISNDLLYFSYCIQNTYIKLNRTPTFSKLLKPGECIIEYLNKISDEGEGFIYKNFSPNKSSERKYLSNLNAKKIDTFRLNIENWLEKKLINKDEYIYLISLVIEATPFVSNIAGTYGAYLKNWDPRSKKNLKLIKPQIFDNNKKNQSFNENSNLLIKKISGDILYLDPPYNSRQYLPNYHLLETIAKYDNPELRGKTGLRNYENQKSDFCKKSYAEDALEDLMSNANFKYTILSYSSDGIIDETRLDKLILKYSNKLNKKYKIPYRRYIKDKDDVKKKLYEMIYIIKNK
tara:strand:- start:358 stop:1377 length:1020 start_codon:yes stop_codon:yes gene_type:complete